MVNLSDAIRRAVACEEFEKATLLWNDYTRYLTEGLRSGSAGQVQLEEARELVEWSRQFALASRAHAAARLKSLRVAETYRQPGAKPSPAVIRASL